MRPDKIAIDFAPEHYQLELPLLLRHVCKGLILDVGCATGSFIKLAADLGYRVIGLDISRPLVGRARSLGLDARLGEITTFKLAEQTVDAVCLWAILEHIVDFKAALRAAHRLLKPRGVLLVTVPNVKSLSHCLGPRFRDFYPTHCNCFSPKTLRHALAEIGFEIAELYTAKFNPITFIQDLFGIHQSVDTRMKWVTRIQEIRTSKSWAPLRFLHHTAAKVLSALGRGELILAAAHKQGDAEPQG